MKNYWNLKSNKKTFLLTIFLLLTLEGYSQLEENHLYEESYYTFPIKPGLRNSLSGTMGELRSSHFHSGIDIRTEGRIGLPVFAAANGYISRVAVSTSGYGNAIYILHPTGETTVYAHLDRFYGPLADYVRNEQYKKQTFDLNLFPEKGDFQIKRGDTIAFAGNSGSSGGPHLHFDLRDKYQNPLNPLKYGFKEIWDRTPPEVHKVALKTLHKDARINGKFGRYEFNVRRVGNDYVIEEPIEVCGQIGAEIYAYDKLDNSRFKCGINEIKMAVDGQEVFRQEISSFSFSEQRNILRHMNYSDLQRSGERFHKLYIDDGNNLRFYTANGNKGKLSFSGDHEHQVKIMMADSYENISNLSFNLKSSDFYKEKVIDTDYSEGDKIELIDNTLLIQAPYHKDSTTAIYTPGRHELKPAYLVNDAVAVYLWDMKKGLPYSADINGTNQLLHYKEMIPSTGSFRYYNERMDLYFPKEALFDTLYLKVDYQLKDAEQTEQFILGNTEIPLRKYISVTLKPQLTHYDADKYSVYAVDSRGNAYYKGGNWENGRITFSTRDFGQYTILEDTIPPTVEPLTINRKSLSFKIEDERSGINSINCYVNDEWVLMNYDYKRNLIWSEKLNPDQPFEGELEVVITDNQGNRKIYKTTIR